MILGLIGIIALLILIFLRMPIAVGMSVVGLLGMMVLMGIKPALLLSGQLMYSTGLDYGLSVLPLFILMGNLINHSGLSGALYRASYMFLGHRRGGLAMSTIFASAGLAAVTGSSLATAATMGRLAMPQMRQYGYADTFASASIAAGGTLGVLIPPSLMMCVYGILTQTDIGLLFIAGVIPGLIGIFGYIAAISAAVRIKPQLAPPAKRFSWPERIQSLRSVIGILGLFVLVIGGIYGGVFTPIEAAGIGAAGALLIALLARRMTWARLGIVLIESARTTAILFALIFGALIFSNFINVAGIPTAVQTFINAQHVPPMVVIVMIIIIYLVLGCVVEGISMMLLTVPIFFPLITSIGFSPIWFGIITAVVTEISFITPPLGLNLLILRSVVPGLKTSDLARGIGPFMIADFVRLIVLVALPILSLWLPSLVTVR